MCLAASKAASAFLRGFRDFVADRPVGAEGKWGAVASTDMENKLNQSQPVGEIMPFKRKQHCRISRGRLEQTENYQFWVLNSELNGTI